MDITSFQWFGQESLTYGYTYASFWVVHRCRYVCVAYHFSPFIPYMTYPWNLNQLHIDLRPKQNTKRKTRGLLLYSFCIRTSRTVKYKTSFMMRKVVLTSYNWRPTLEAGRTKIRIYFQERGNLSIYTFQPHLVIATNVYNTNTGFPFSTTSWR